MQVPALVPQSRYLIAHFFPLGTNILLICTGIHSIAAQHMTVPLYMHTTALHIHTSTDVGDGGWHIGTGDLVLVNQLLSCDLINLASFKCLGPLGHH